MTERAVWRRSTTLDLQLHARPTKSGPPQIVENSQYFTDSPCTISLVRMQNLNGLNRGHLAPPPRTLVDIVRASADAHPDAAAIDDGSEILTYAELVTAVDDAELTVGEEAGDAKFELDILVLEVLPLDAALVLDAFAIDELAPEVAVMLEFPLKSVNELRKTPV